MVCSYCNASGIADILLNWHNYLRVAPRDHSLDGSACRCLCLEGSILAICDFNHVPILTSAISTENGSGWKPSSLRLDH